MSCIKEFPAPVFEADVQMLLVDALYFAWRQAEDTGIRQRADQFRTVYLMARDGKIGLVEK